MKKIITKIIVFAIFGVVGWVIFKMVKEKKSFEEVYKEVIDKYFSKKKKVALVTEEGTEVWETEEIEIDPKKVDKVKTVLKATGTVTAAAEIVDELNKPKRKKK